jgi:MurNAc alpha-1-phosphate uridylyltransferase
MSFDTAPVSHTSPCGAIVLAAGRGERMRPLTDITPKPLLKVHGNPLMQYHLEALIHAGCPAALINTAWLGEQIEAAFGSVFRLERSCTLREPLLNSEQADAADSPPMALRYSHEGRDFGGALETAGGIARALPQLDTVFWSLAGDVFAPDLPLSAQALERFATSDMLAHLWLVPNPAHHPRGDFGLGDVDAHGIGACTDPDADPAWESTSPRYTFSGFALYRRALFQPPWCEIAHGNPQGLKAALAPLLRRAMRGARVSAEIYTGRWTDVGTPERLNELNASP